MITVGKRVISSPSFKIKRDAALTNQSWRTFALVQVHRRRLNLTQAFIIEVLNFFTPLHHLASKNVKAIGKIKGLGEKRDNIIPV